MPIYDCFFTGVAGHVRPNNEDNFYLNGNYKADPDALTLQAREQCSRGTFAVFDGMGGTDCGELASLYAAKALLSLEDGTVHEHMEEFILTANENICNWRRENGDASCGTTMAVLSLWEGRAVCCNMGDSRIYLWRDGELLQLSEEHTLAALMVKMGLYRDESEAEIRERHTLTRYLGAYAEEGTLSPYCGEPFDVQEDDVFLLCSDGLTDMLTDEDIGGILQQGGSAEELATALQNKALEQGGRDNITIGIVQNRRTV